MFSLSNLTYQYDSSHVALRNLNVEIPKGEITAVLGMSGSGKSTLLAMLGLLRKQNSFGQGAINYRGREFVAFDQLSRNQSASLRARDFGFVLQSSFLMPNLTCQHNVVVPLLLAGVPWRQAQLRLQTFVNRLETVSRESCSQLSRQLTKLPSRLSGGQRQRMAVIRAILHDPQVVMADEPFSSLDPESADRTSQLLCDWQEGKLTLGAGVPEHMPSERSLLIVTHDLDRARRMAERFLLMRHGECLENRVWTRAELPSTDQLLKLLAGTESSSHAL